MAFTKAVSLDCEMVIDIYGKHVPAQVAIVNKYGRQLYNTFVRQLQTNVADYLTWITGITADDLKNGRDPEELKRQVACIIRGRFLVGHDVSKDLKCLELSHPECDIRDTAVYFKNVRGFRKLKDLALEHLNWRIQNGTHDALEDARACMRLYRKFQYDWEMSITVKERYRSDNPSNVQHEAGGLNRYNFSQDQWGRTIIQYKDTQVGGGNNWFTNLVEFFVTVAQYCFTIVVFIFILMFLISLVVKK